MANPPSRMADSQVAPRLFLIDGYALLYRAFFAMISRPLTTSRGENTSAPFGLARFLMRLLTTWDPAYLGVALDAGDSFRTEVFPAYKATREKMPDELAASLPRCRKILEGFRIPVIEVDGWEADDVIGSLAHRAASAGLHTVIVSGDKDFYQLIDDRVSLLNPGRRGPAAVDEELVTTENAHERFGVSPERITDYLALIGDSSDNIPGVRGIGAKTAPGLIGRFGSLEDILAAADGIDSGRVRRALLEGADGARLSKRLVTIRTDAPVELDLEMLHRSEPDLPALREIFRELEFRGLARELGAPAEAQGTETPASPPARIVTEAAEVAAVAERLASSPSLGVCALGRTPDGGLVGLGLSAGPGATWYVPLGHRPGATAYDEAGNPTLALDATEAANLPRLDAGEMEPLAALLADPAAPKVGHDLKTALTLIERSGGTLEGLAFDTEIASYCLDPGRPEHSAASLASERLNRRLASGEELSGSGRSRLPMAEVEPERASVYAGGIAEAVLALRESLTEDLDRHGMLDLYRRVELPLIRVLSDMEKAGVRIDPEFFASLETRIRKELERVREAIFARAGEPVNLRSVPQLRALLFERLELPVLRRTKTGPSTDESVLAELASRGHEVPRLILEHRELDKLNSTYVTKLPRLVDPATGRLHTTFNQTVTATGRLSSSDPNLQNIPIRSALGREIRKGFQAEDGCLLLSADYSQIELRVLAHLSGDPAFLDAFGGDGDIHRETAARIFGVPSEQVSGDMRGRAKTINFATIYGQGPAALAAQLDIERAEAEAFIEQYFERFSGVRRFFDEMRERARERGYVETILGRRRYVPEIRSRNPGVRGFGERTAANSPIQGSAADLIKLAMISLHARLRGEEARMLLQVHDELLFEVPEPDVERVGEIVRAEMEGAMKLSVPLRVDLGWGRTWFDCKDAG
ncbi:MAG: DNA polymerase I [Gemmatimonadota bacterium]